MAGFGIHPHYQSKTAKVDLILVHGLTGNSRNTWTGKDSQGKSTYWPDWVEQRRPHVNIWLADYESSLSAWLQPTLTLDEIGGAFLSHAEDLGLGARPIHWVGHSMGGLIIKLLLCQARIESVSSTSGIDKAHTAITFLGTPHHGSDLATWKNYFTFFLKGLGQDNESHIDQLSAHGRGLGKLNDDFAHWLQSASQGSSLVRVRNYYETKPVLKMVTVVPKHLATLPNALVVNRATEANHFDICKFASQDSAVFTGILASLDALSPPASPPGVFPDTDEPALEELAGDADQTQPQVLPFVTTGVSIDPACDLTDRAWRNALSECPSKAQALACRHLAGMLETSETTPQVLADAIATTFERRKPHMLIGNLKRVLQDAAYGLPPDWDQVQRDALTGLYLMLLVRAAVLAYQPILKTAAEQGLVVPNARGDSMINDLAIVVAAHVIYGQGVQLTLGPQRVHVENLIDLAALPDASAHPPSQLAAPSPLQLEILAWLKRLDDIANIEASNDQLMGFLAGMPARPVLLDRNSKWMSEANTTIARALGLGVVRMQAEGCVPTVREEDWGHLHQALHVTLQHFAGGQGAGSQSSDSA